VRLEKDIESLRKRDSYHAFRAALTTAYRRDDFRVVHISLQRAHAHFVVEVDDERALAKGMQGLQVAAARRLNAAISKRQKSKRCGRVFVDRYHARILRTPSEVRHAINYVINNWRHHDEHVGLESRFWQVDYFSSGPTFTGWREPIPPLPRSHDRRMPNTRARRPSMRRAACRDHAARAEHGTVERHLPRNDAPCRLGVAHPPSRLVRVVAHPRRGPCGSLPARFV
jgi:REP element-mobilizing transposase RayT